MQKEMEGYRSLWNIRLHSNIYRENENLRKYKNKRNENACVKRKQR
jgi:hypothetical protein